QRDAGSGRGVVVESVHAYIDGSTNPDTAIVELTFVGTAPPFGVWLLTPQGALIVPLYNFGIALRIGADEAVTFFVLAGDPTELPGWHDSCLLPGDVRVSELQASGNWPPA